MVINYEGINKMRILAISAVVLCLFSQRASADDLTPKCKALAQALAEQITGIPKVPLENSGIYLVDQNGGEPLVQVELYLNTQQKLFIFTTFGANFNYIRDGKGNYVPVPNPGGKCTAAQAPGT